MSVIEAIKLSKPNTDQEAEQMVQQIAGHLNSINTKLSENSEAHARAAADLKLVKEGLEANKTSAELALEKAANAEAIAQGSARTVLQQSPGYEKALKSMTLAFNVDADPMFKGSAHNFMYNLASLNREELRSLPEEAQRPIERFVRLWAGLAVADIYMNDCKDRRAYQARGGWQSLPGAKEFVELAKVFKGVAMDESESGGGADWVPTGVLPQLQLDVRPEFSVNANVPQVTLPRSPITLPVQRDYLRAKKGSEATASTGQTQMGTVNVGTANMTFTAALVEMMTVYSTQLEDDAIVELMSIVPAEQRIGIMASIEAAHIDGQLSATIDTGDASITGADDRLLWNGLRYMQSLTGVGINAGSGVTVEMCNALAASMGRYGFNPSNRFWATGYIGWAKVLTLKDSAGTAVYTTNEKVGGAGTAQTGTIGSLLGSPLCVSDIYRQDLNNAGIYDGVTTDRTSLLLACKSALKMGTVRAIRMESSSHQFFQFNQMAYKATLRGQLQPLRTPSASYPIVGALYNIAIS